jgi:predicted DNA-binding transcriptional regulator AlpA
VSELLDLTEIAQLLKLPRTYVRDKLVKNGDFPAPALSLSQRMRRWRQEDVRAWIERQHAEQCR